MPEEGDPSEVDRWVIKRGLGPDATEDSVRASMPDHANPTRVLIAKNVRGKCAGFCWILFPSSHEARLFERLDG